MKEIHKKTKHVSLDLIFKFSLGISIVFILAFIVTAADVVVEAGDLTIEGKLNVLGEADISGTLTLNEGIILGNYGTKPTCDAAHLGMLVFDTTNDKPYVCASSNTWNPLDSDYDSDGIVAWLDNDDTLADSVCDADDGGWCFINESSKSSLEPDLIAENIKDSVTIFGVTGMLPPGDVTQALSAARQISCTSGWHKFRETTIPADAKKLMVWMSTEVVQFAYGSGLRAAYNGVDIIYVDDNQGKAVQTMVDSAGVPATLEIWGNIRSVGGCGNIKSGAWYTT